MRDDRNGVPNGRAGSPTNGVLHMASFTRVLPGADDGAEPRDVDAPIDLVAVQADDELVTTLGSRSPGPVAHRAGPGEVPARDVAGPGAEGRIRDDRLIAMLAAWRAEVDADPIPELIDLDAAVAAVVAGVQAQESASRRKRAGRLRQLAPLVAAAAVIVATVTGVGLGSQDAVPGDVLWSIQKVVNPERAESVEAKVEVEGRLQKVRSALEKGDTITAAHELDAIRTQIPVVRGQEGQPQLVQEQEFLAAKLADTPPGTPADLATPSKSNPAARPTGTAPAPPASVPPSVDPSTGPSASVGSVEPKPTEPDPRSRGVDGVDPRLAPVEPEGSRSPVRPAPEVTTAPDVPQPKPNPQPTEPGGEGKPDPTTDPGPVVRLPPPSKTEEGPLPGTDDQPPATSDATASGSAGASLDTTVTDTTTT